jgi:hypothetical protein
MSGSYWIKWLMITFSGIQLTILKAIIYNIRLLDVYVLHSNLEVFCFRRTIRYSGRIKILKYILIRPELFSKSMYTKRLIFSFVIRPKSAEKF